MSTENQVHLVGDKQIDEAVAAATISPGMLIEKTSAGKYQAHSTEGGRALLRFAEVDALQGNGLDTDYSADDRVTAVVEEAGNSVQAFLKAGENVAIGAKLISAGDGTLIAEASASSGVTVKQVIAEAYEAKDLSGSGAVATLMRVTLLEA